MAVQRKQYVLARSVVRLPVLYVTAPCRRVRMDLSHGLAGFGVAHWTVGVEPRNDSTVKVLYRAIPAKASSQVYRAIPGTKPGCARANDCDVLGNVRKVRQLVLNVSHPRPNGRDQRHAHGRRGQERGPRDARVLVLFLAPRIDQK